MIHSFRPAAAVLAALLSMGGRAFAYEGGKEQVVTPLPPKAPVLTKAPELKSFVEAVYPEEAQRLSLTADVSLLIDIGPDGQVAAAEIARSSGRKDFDEAAVAAVKKFVFTPAELDGVPALVRIEYLYRFVLKPPEPPPVPEAAPPPRPVTLKGKIVERGSRSPIASARVACVGSEEEALTDPLGVFELRPSPGICTVDVQTGTHLPYSHIERIVEGQVLEVTYHLMPKVFGLFQTVVRGQREKREAVRRTLDREELQKVPGSMGDPIRVIQNLPGVARAPFLSGQLIVRGASPGETGTYFDGVEIPLLYHFLGGPSVVNPEFLDRIDFYPGGFGPRYGRAIGGILDASTRRVNLEEAHGSAKVDLIDSAAFVEVPLGHDMAVAVAGRRSYIDLLLPLFIPSDPRTGTINILPRYWDYQVRVDRAKKDSPHSFTAMAFGSDDRLVVVATGGQLARAFTLDVNTTFHRGRVSWTFRQGDFANTFSPFVGKDAIVASLADTGYNQGFWAGGLRDELAWTLPGGHTLRLGADVTLEETKIKVVVPPPPDYRTFPGERPTKDPETIERRIDNHDLAAYSELELKLGGLTLLPGLRVDQYRLHGVGRSATDPRLTARFKLTEETSIKGSIGHYTMAPDPGQFDPQFGNPGIFPEKAFQSSLGVEHKITEVINVDVAGFYNRRYNLVVNSGKVTVGDDGTVKPERYNNDGLGRAYGVELLLRHEITDHFFGWLAYTLSRTEGRRVGQETYLVGSYDETHILAVVGQYKFGNGFELGSRFRLVTGRPRTPIVGSTYDADTDSYRSVGGLARSERNPMFHQLDVRLDKTFLFNYWKLAVYLDVQNLYYAKNVEGSQYDYRFRERTDIPGLPILPTLGVKGSF